MSRTGFESRISYLDGEPGAILMEDLQIVSSANADRIKESPVKVSAGERVLVLGAPGTGKTQLFVPSPDCGPGAAGKSAGPGESKSSTCRAARRICRAARFARCSPIR